ncbi:uncharacterized protein FIBRA_02206 [Fibroporia radiculosa]|uniref:Uncharacterized protein n=1 Tax=Fibroporia radiculosa TaxID=599839 RepID=J4G1E8_9APHY|nr:uncharacterized protein FIBRA_02206 [Fibroporia radiculosa]CCM00178.1 predicted protein [Fibroporia radiculosa]
MIPLVPALALAFVSFISSVFVVLRIIVPILPPHPLSRRVRPVSTSFLFFPVKVELTGRVQSEFGLPNFRSLSPAEKSHVWLASCDVLALALFIWQVVSEYLSNSVDYDATRDPSSAVRLWLALTLRQTCLFIVATITLVHVRMGRTVALGKTHWMLWAPTLLLVVTSTALAGVLSATGLPSFFMGLFAYTTILAIGSSMAFVGLIITLVIIKRNLAALDEAQDSWPPAKEIGEKPRPSFATEDIDVLKDGSSWITSHASSRRTSISAFSFSTHHSAKPSNGSVRMAQNPAMASQPSIPHKSSFWFNPAMSCTGHESPIPPVPPLPSPYRSSSPTSDKLHDDPDPFRREPRDRMGSQSSWLTEPSTYQPTLSAWSFPRTCPGSPPPSATTPDLLLPSTTAAQSVPAMASAQVLGGYGYDAEGNPGSLASKHSSDLDVSIFRTIGWLITIWVPLVLSLPYVFMVTLHAPLASSAASITLIVSMTLSSPLLALHVILRSPFPIPTQLFESYHEPPSAVMRAPSPMSAAPSFKFSHEYKRSGSITVVEGRRSGDVWVSNGDAIDGRSKISRALGLLQPVPRLAVLPVEDIQEAPLTPPLPMQSMPNTPVRVPDTPQSENSAELGKHGRPRKESKASSYYSGGSEALASQIMIAQKHYSTLAMTLVVPPSPEHRASLDAIAADAGAIDVAATGVDSAPNETTRPSQHLRSRSISSIQSRSDPRFPMSPPPLSPLPPTPPSVKELRERQARMIVHRKSQSHSSSLLDYSFRPVDDDNIAEIDALSAGVLPILVPGLTVGSDMRVREWNWESPVSIGSRNSKMGLSSLWTRNSRIVPAELGGLSSEFSSPEMHSTPPLRKVAKPRERKTSAHKRHHFSLPSLSLGKEGIHALSTWRNDITRAVDARLGPYSAATTSEVGRRNTVYGGELVANIGTHLNVVSEEEELLRPISPPVACASSPRPASTSTFGPTLLAAVDAADGMSTARNSLATLITALDQELRMPPQFAASEVTLFDFEDTQGPQAESTPHESKQRSRPTSQNVPSVPQLPLGSKRGSRSSITYIKSDENTPPVSKPATISPKAISEWSSRAVRPLAPKIRAKADKAKAAKQASASPRDSSNSGLRPLSLLQDRDANTDGVSETRGLSLKKKQKNMNDENANPTVQSKAKGLRPLKLARNDTTKERAVLRKIETLPDVVVRPPSESHRNDLGLSFRS